MKRSSELSRVALVMCVTLVAAACGGDGEDGGNAQQPGDAEDTLRVGHILDGSISDAHWNALHYESMQNVAEDLGMEVSIAENVEVADGKRVAQQFVADGIDVVLLGSSAYFPATLELAQEFPDTNFVTMVGGPPPEDQPENLWLLGLNFYPGEYVMGALAALESERGKVAFLSGLELPSTIAGANGFFEGARSVDPDVELDYVFTGDFFDASKNRDAAAALIRKGSDVILAHLGDVSGAVEAVRSSEGVNWAGLYTDQHDLAPDTFLGALLFDFEGAYREVFSEIQDGTTSGFLDLALMISLSELYNVSSETESTVQEMLEQVRSGEIEVEPKPEKVVIP